MTAVDFQPFLQLNKDLGAYNVSSVEHETRDFLNKLEANKQNFEHIFSQFKVKKEEIRKIIEDAILAITEILSVSIFNEFAIYFFPFYSLTYFY